MKKKVAVPMTPSLPIEYWVAYERALAFAGLEMFPIRLESRGQFRESCSGLLLAGGHDIDPFFYNREKNGSREPDIVRDQLEIELVKIAMLLEIPILGICRGMQIMNVALGGTLIQHLLTADVHAVKDEDRPTLVKSASRHSVKMRASSKLARICGNISFEVNSRHHQAIAKLGGGVNVAGLCPQDAVVEAIEVNHHPFGIGVEWHPEDMLKTSSESVRIFHAFSEAIG